MENNQTTGAIPDLELAEETLRRIDVRGIGRDVWRRCFCGKERLPAQQFFVRMAQSRAGTEADERAFLQAAFAILPLHGTPLRRLAALLADDPLTTVAWADALALAISEGPAAGTPETVAARRALGTLARAELPPADRRRLDIILRGLADQGRPIALPHSPDPAR